MRLLKPPHENEIAWPRTEARCWDMRFEGFSACPAFLNPAPSVLPSRVPEVLDLLPGESFGLVRLLVFTRREDFKILGAVIPPNRVDVMDNFPTPEWAPQFSRCYDSVFVDIPCFLASTVPSYVEKNVTIISLKSATAPTRVRGAVLHPAHRSHLHNQCSLMRHSWQ